MTAELEVRALVAERFASAADDAARRGDEAGMVRAADKLLEVMDTLPVRTPGGGGSGDGAGDDERGSLLQLIDGPPTVGDAAHA